jgi:hypothetical protein
MTYSILVENNKESKGEKAAQEPHQVAEINISIRLIKNVQMQGDDLSYELRVTSNEIKTLTCHS